MAKKVLLISPYFPPHRAIGTKRAINFVQGVQGSEWEVIVLASKPFNDNVDEELSSLIPKEAKVDYGFVGLLRPIIKMFTGGSKKKKPTSNSEERNLPKKRKTKLSYTPFDQYLWDVNGAVRRGKKLIKEYKPDVIWVNADPWSGFLVARRLSKKFGIPWVADMRDPWSIFKRKMDTRPGFIQRIIKKYEKNFFHSSAKVVLNSEAAYDEYVSLYEMNDKFTFIRNAFNDKLFSEPKNVASSKVFTFGYYGGFRDFVPSNYILKGFATFVKNNKLKPSMVKLEVVGSVYPEFWYQVNELQIKEFVVFGGEINSKEAIELLRSWDVLLLCAIHELRWQMPAKFYDYLYARKPMLAISDNHELNQLIESTNSGKWALTAEEEKSAKLFEDFYTNGKSSLLNNQDLIKPFGSEKQAENFRKILKEVTSSTLKVESKASL